jgi:hypothetical protein
MHKNILTVVGITILFLGVAVQPSIATVQSEEIEIEPKDYLFQTIIDIANSPEVKKLLEQYDNDLFELDIDRGVYRKLFLRNSKLLFNTIFTKPTMSIENLNKCYNRGFQIANILGEYKSLEIVESIHVIDTEVIDKLNNIIKNDVELFDNIAILQEMNKELYSYESFWDNYPIICSILFLIFLTIGFIWSFWLSFTGLFINVIRFIEEKIPFLYSILAFFDLHLFYLFISPVVIMVKLDCIVFDPYLEF